MDAWINLNDCRRRLATFTFVLVLDYDELLVPTSPHNTLREVFKAALAKFPDAAYFVSHSHIHLTDWGRTYNDTDLFFLTHLQMTKSNMLDSQGRGRSSQNPFSPQPGWSKRKG
ncbi:hypothetical protein C0Q70_19563 [Pomacea canaliculata]|uniref:Glycosyltransferase family 92 protein n=1 Tax=Pomacea canaliculata TaxID=400727 RepID=A0A2T7NJP1_POMCA|nr:hypothetical protein C0Q70_19563 [Pomacea canaliculata]